MVTGKRRRGEVLWPGNGAAGRNGCAVGGRVERARRGAARQGKVGARKKRRSPRMRAPPPLAESPHRGWRGQHRYYARLAKRSRPRRKILWRVLPPIGRYCVRLLRRHRRLALARSNTAILAKTQMGAGADAGQTWTADHA